MFGDEFLTGNTIMTKMQVVDIHGYYIGEVKEVYDGEFLVNRALKRDLIIPSDRVHKIERAMIHLQVPKKEVDRQGWKKPRLF